MNQETKSNQAAPDDSGARPVQFWKEVVKVIKDFPLKELSAISLGIGACIVTAYYVHIEYLPSLDAVNIPFLFGQVFYAGLLACLVFLSLFVTVFFGANFTASYRCSSESLMDRMRVAYAGKLLLAHFPLALLYFAAGGSTDVSDVGRAVAWVLLVAWLIGQVLLLRRIRKLAGQIVGVQQEDEDQMTQRLNTAIQKRHARLVVLDKEEGAWAREEAQREEKALLVDMENAEAHIKESKIAEKRRKQGGTWFFYLEYSFLLLVVAGASVTPLSVLGVIMDVAPASAKIGMFQFLATYVAWCFITTTISLAPKFGIREKLAAGLCAIVVVLGMTQVLYLPVVLTAGIAGIGQIHNADIALSNARCAIVLAQLSAAGLPDTLKCVSDNNSTAVAGVLKRVLILNRVGTEFYIEVSADGVRQDVAGDKNLKSVFRLRIPKSEAYELIRTRVPLTAQQVQEREKQSVAKEKTGTGASKQPTVPDVPDAGDSKGSSVTNTLPTSMPPLESPQPLHSQDVWQPLGLLLVGAVLLAVGLVLVIVLPKGRRKIGTGVFVVGAAATLFGGMKFEGTLLKIDKLNATLFKVDKVDLTLLKVDKLEAELKLVYARLNAPASSRETVKLMSIGPFPSARHQLDGDIDLTCLQAKLEDRNNKIYSLDIVGKVDKRELKPENRRIYGSNQTLAQVRGEWVEAYLRSHVPGLQQQAVAIAVNGASHFGEKVSDSDLGSDRSVAVYASVAQDSPLRNAVKGAAAICP